MNFFGEGGYTGLDDRMQQFIEDEERERERKALEDWLLRGPRQQEAQPMVQSQPDSALNPLADFFAQRFNPQREARLQQMRQQTPRDISAQLQQEFWGSPTSKAGKIGTGIAKAAAGFFGTPMPDFNKMGLQQYAAQQKAVNDEEASDARETAAALQAWARQGQTAAGERNAQLASRTKLQDTFLKTRVMQDANEIKRMVAQAQMLGIGADAAKKMAQTEILKRQTSTMEAMGLKDLSARAAALRGLAEQARKDGKPEEADAIEEQLKFMVQVESAQAAEKRAKPGTPGSTRVSTRTQILEHQLPNGKVVKVEVPLTPSTSVSSGRPGVPGAGALNALFSGGQSEAPDEPQQAAQPGQLPAAPRLPPSAQAAPAENREEVNFGFASRTGDQPRVKMTYVSPYRILAEKPQTGAQSTVDTADKEFRKASYGLLDHIESAAKEGKFGEIVGLVNNPLDFLGEGTTLRFKRATQLGDPKARALQDALYQAKTSQGAQYVKKMSGAQAAVQEYTRLMGMFSDLKDAPDTYARLAYINAIGSQLMAALENYGVLDGSTIGSLKAAEFVFEKSKEFVARVTNMDRVMASNPKLRENAEREFSTAKLRDIDGMVLELIQQRMPQLMGTKKKVPARGGGYYEIEFPKTTNEQGNRLANEMERKKQEDEARRALRGLR